MSKKLNYTDDQIDEVSKRLAEMITKQKRAKQWRNYKLGPFAEMLFTGTLLFFFLMWFLKG